MKNNKDNERLVSYIIKHIPSNIKKTAYLTRFLNLSEESVYRRLRGDIPFTVEELVKLSQELKFSIDKAVLPDTIQGQALFNMRTDTDSEEETFSQILKDYCDDVKKEAEANNRRAIMSLNHIILPFTFNYEILFRFNYYKWVHQTQDVPLNFSFSEVAIPTDIDLLRQEAAVLSDSVDNSTIIIDENMYLHTIKDIQYYYRRNLITRDELEQIKQELIFMIEQLERTIQRGFNRLDKVRNFYLSPLNIKSNIILSEYEDTIVSHLWYNSLTPISTTNLSLCMAHKKWLNSLKKYSILITQSNEMLSSDFFNKQRKYINEIHILS